MKDRTEELYPNADLAAEQQKTLATPRLKYNPISKMLFLTFDVVYGKARVLGKFKVLELLARYPYWSWENGGYKMISREQSRRKPSRRERVELMLEHIELGRASQDNEQWHLLLLDDVMRQKGLSLGFLKGVLLPRLIAWSYFHANNLIYWLNPAWSFQMNAAFEDHAEHEYMTMVQEHPEWEQEEVESKYFEYYPRQKSLADLLRRIGLDERVHKDESLEALERWRAAGQ